mmetsp:Transcript_20916/g.48537  ORF Transcript_20916/g.48537 Transcript_20916/m.48537 type:complete len:121 (+) Transcript_20916:150-512(+)|eukprot:CAMPEP_0182564224 /NCGR_PEP_ID=MMETSP1324-20130603/6210_1 /TAXON_ID=236786 /ORGANISM="Florenciella sp., Strain RCC1587" /LENGTH=120 /DNA_ID=CAMNT_0024777625 /DNA_START=148 /DNA_END=510 /DNA_ORIENTATION=+
MVISRIKRPFAYDSKRSKALKRRGISIEANVEFLFMVLRSEQFQPYLGRFLKFVTACGVCTRDLEITIELSQELKRTSYPEARTCFSTLVMPDMPYESAEELARILVFLAENALVGFGGE